MLSNISISKSKVEVQVMGKATQYAFLISLDVQNFSHRSWQKCSNMIGQFAVVYKSTDNAARVNASRNAFISLQTWMTRKCWRGKKTVV